MSYKIGQVLYILQNNEAKVVPVQVVEEVVKKTIEGSSTSYIVKFVPSKKELDVQNVELSRIKGEIFISPEKLKKALVQKVTAAMHAIVDSAVEKAAIDFNVVQEQQAPVVEQIVEPEFHSSEEFVNVTMPDGSVVKVKM